MTLKTRIQATQILGYEFKGFGRVTSDLHKCLAAFDAQKRYPKIDNFWNPQKSTKMVESIDPWAPKLRFWHQKSAFWHQIWHRFFSLFPKLRKCEISEEYNAKRGSEPSKTFDFRIDFSLFFNDFSEPPSKDNF